ncbi:hypothetical protein KY309_02315 [Candidatus Woesearchaeota archaeon]|nr:hypothetical protein [Candidatus Woesearchaeota archaeon]MBW3016421.1 hypothetical protein [Candidatus Woesearchaeota archaeon]
MTELDKLFEEEEKIQKSVREISVGLLEMSDFVLAKSPVELASAEIVGKRIRRACDMINDEVHIARKKIGVLLTHKSKVKFKKAVRSLHEMEDELSLIHGDIDAIGDIAESFYESKDRKTAFENLNRHYSELVGHVTSLIIDEENLKSLS